MYVILSIISFRNRKSPLNQGITTIFPPALFSSIHLIAFNLKSRPLARGEKKRSSVLRSATRPGWRFPTWAPQVGKNVPDKVASSSTLPQRVIGNFNLKLLAPFRKYFIVGLALLGCRHQLEIFPKDRLLLLTRISYKTCCLFTSLRRLFQAQHRLDQIRR
jgi:hypothetical protein